MWRPEDFFGDGGGEHKELFAGVDKVWEVLPRIKTYLQKKLSSIPSVFPEEGTFFSRTVVLWKDRILEEGFSLQHGNATKGEFKVFYQGRELEDWVVLFAGATLIGKDIYLGPKTVVEPGAYIKGPTYIGGRTEIRQGAYLRGGCIVGDGCVVGHVTEMKNSVFFNGAKAGHFAYIGDSLVGKNCNLGAGTKLANLKVVGGNIRIRHQGREWDTGLRKFGAVLGDGCETGCNSVTNPGTLLGPRCLVGPNATIKAGYYPPRSVIR
jgi:NDP-sugar pyrophosphorylase family protein